MNYLQKYLQKQIWYTQMMLSFWTNPHRLHALKVFFAMSVLLIPTLILGKAYIGVTLALGALACALAETDDHPKGRINALFLTIASFLLSAFSVQILRSFPLIFGIGFVISTILFVLIGGISERYRGISFGAILIGIYTMLGAGSYTNWYWQPLLLAGGALFYGLISLGFLIKKPMRLLDEQFAGGFHALSEYLFEKANLFPSSENDQANLRNRLSILNIKVVVSLEKIKEALNSYSDVIKDTEELAPYLQRFMILQSLHERAASSHEKYEQISQAKNTLLVVDGFGELLRQLSFATKHFAKCLLTNEKYKHPLTPGLIIKALENQLKELPDSTVQSMQLLLHNLNRSNDSLKNIDLQSAYLILPRLKRDSRGFWEKLKSLINIKHQRMRYAIRLSCSFLLGYFIIRFVSIDKGEWILLTSLFVSQPSYSETRKRLMERVSGTIAGVILGIILLRIFPDQSIQVLILLLSAYAFFNYLRRNYSLAVIFITIFVLCAYNLVSLEGIDVMFPRVLATILGALISILVVRFLWPDWQYKRLPALLSAAALANLNYFKAITKEYTQSNLDDYDYRVARRDAHLADNDLALSWRGMRLDPKNRQHLLQNAFDFTYLNHALLSYLSAFGAHRDSNRIRLQGLEDITGSISTSLEWLSRYLSGASDDMVFPDIDSVLLHLKQLIDTSESNAYRQQLRLLYNITDVISGIISEAKVVKTAYMNS